MTLTEFFDTDFSLPREDILITCKGIRTCLNSMDYYHRQGEPLVIYYIMYPNSPYNFTYTDNNGKICGYLNVSERHMLKLATQIRDAFAEKHFWQRQLVTVNLRTMQVVKD